MMTLTIRAEINDDSNQKENDNCAASGNSEIPIWSNVDMN